MKKVKWTQCLLALAMLFLMMAVLTVNAAADDTGTSKIEVVTDGSTSSVCGETVSWRYIESGKTLIISGTGPMYDYDSPSKTPWAAYMTDIETVIVTEGVTTVGKNALNGA
ncbi:MAG: hypothetical protein IKC97_05620, partial [Clostridia bacterium]|nr:hypothetical protein [Clostridia bacterium]